MVARECQIKHVHANKSLYNSFSCFHVHFNDVTPEECDGGVYLIYSFVFRWEDVIRHAYFKVHCYE